MELGFNDIQYIVQKSMEAATLATVLALEPAGAYILESDVKRWLKYNILDDKGKEDGNTFSKFQSLVERGIIKGTRRGKSRRVMSITTRQRSRRLSPRFRSSNA